MTQENKQLLLQDLCSRLPYGVKVTWDDKYPLTITPHIYCAIASEHNIDSLPKLLLRSMSSMTEEQIEEAKTYFWKDVDYGKSLVDKGINCFYPCFNILEFYHKNHIDYRGLIEKGLALDATGLNVY